MGIRPDAAGNLVETLPRLTRETAWAEIRHLPELANQIGVKHWGTVETQFTNESGPSIRWKASFPGRGVNGQAESYVILTVAEGQTRTVSASDTRRD
jgi:hypothetical protein